MHTVFDVLIIAAVLAVAATLGLGLYSLYRGGDFAKKYSNKLMRLRVLLQFVAILILVSAFIWNRHNPH
jgi:drug/metabolite transporter (DMT)-like permease